LSLRDLPVWSRGVAALLVLIAGWYVPRAEGLVTAVGYSALEVSAGVVAVSLLLGMRLPFDLWPQQPERERFSIPLAVLVAAVMGGLILASRPSGVTADLATTNRGLLVMIVAGGTVWAVGWGRIRQRAFARWYAVAGVAALVPVVVRVAAVMLQDRVLPAIHLTTFVQVGGFFFVAAAAGALVTQELAFRRLLIGQAGDAGLAVVLIAAVVFGCWLAVVPEPPGGVLQAGVSGALHGVVLGSLYTLSRSLLVPAVYHGVSASGIRAFDLAAIPTEGATGVTDVVGVGMVATGIVGAILAYHVYRQSGFLGLLTRRRLPDAVSD
jgi:hypothetical protein